MKRKIVMAGMTLLMLTGCGGSTITSSEKQSEVSENTDKTENTEKTESTTTSSTATDYGKLSFGMHQVRVGYTRKITPRFTNEEVGKTEVLHYESSDEAGLKIDEDGTMHGLATGNYKVTVTSEHFKETSFYAHVTSDDRFASKVTSRFNSYLWSDYPEQGRTLFAGDSFFDTEFWSNFYSSYYGNYNTYTMGISATQADDWYYYVDKLLIPFEPENIVFHLGTNDINDAGMSGESTHSLLVSIFEKIHEELPETKIYIFGIEPSISFSGNLAKELACNELTKAYCDKSDYVTYLDTPSLFMNETNNGANSSMLRDGLHPKLEYYSLYDQLLSDAGLEMTLLPGKEDTQKSKSFIALNSANDNYVTRGEDDSSLTIDAITSGQQDVSNRLFYTTDHKNMYKGDLMVKGKVQYPAATGNHFIELYFGPSTNLWETTNSMQFLLWNENAMVFNVQNGVKTITSDTDYEFTAILSGTKAYVKFLDSWYYRDLGEVSGFSLSCENMIAKFTSLTVTTDSSTITASVPETVDYTF